MNFKLIIPTFLLCAGTSQIALAVPQANLVKDFSQELERPLNHNTLNMVHVDGKQFFSADDGVHGMEVWQTDGTAAGTKMVTNTPDDGVRFSANRLILAGNTLFQTSRAEAFQDPLPYKLSSINRDTGEITSLTTISVSRLGSIGSQILFPTPFEYATDVDGTLFFVNESRHTEEGVGYVYDSELWKSDGTIEGTSLVKKFTTPYYPVAQLITLNNKLIFRRGQKLWQSDGTEAGTTQINGNYHLDSSFLNINGTLFFTGDKELWKFDGTTAGATQLFHNAIPEAGDNATIEQLVNLNNKLFFVVKDGKSPSTHSLWSSDVNSAGNLLVTLKSRNGLISAHPSRDASPFDKFTSVNDTLFFSGVDEEHGRELWRSDGSKTGTHMLKDINPGQSGSYPHSLTSINDTLFFNADDGVHGAELWKTDGSTAGTMMVKDIHTGDGYAEPPSHFTDVNGTLFFFAGDGTGGRGLWQTGGTETDTILISDTVMSSRSKFNIDSIDNKVLYFTKEEPSLKLWAFNNNTDTTEITETPGCEAGLDPQSIQKGDGTALWWWSQNAVAGSINKGIGETTIPSDYKWIHPTETTAYTMTVKGANGAETTCEATITVEESLPPICEMGADPQEITAGEGTALWWWSQNVSSATINNEKWSVSVPSDYAWFYPSETAAYTMTAIGDDGSTTTCNTTITVK